MKFSQLRAALRRALMIASVAGFSMIAGQLVAQSDIVFMTADINPGFDSKLVRFDSGSESFATDTSASDAFLGVTILNNEVLVADSQAEKIQRFDPAGTYLGPFASSILATFLESDSSGNVYTTPFSLGPLLGANYATRFNSAGIVTGTISHPDINVYSGIDADADGNIYVAGTSSPPANVSRLYKFAPDGTFLNSILLTARADDLSIDEVNQRLFMAHENGAPGIEIYDIAGAVPILAGSFVTPVTADIIGIHYAAESGNILATDFGIASGDPRGLEYSPIGMLLAEYRPTNAFVALDITTFTVIPEPGSMALMFLAVGGLGLKRSARQR
jgi:hypothetical protein